MIASQKSFSFMKAPNYFEIPFFQRNYVWKLENWEELLDNFLDTKQGSFLGSIILKQKNVPSGEIACFSVIDGQQRLTTLSILLRACYDTLMTDKTKYTSEVINDLTAKMNGLLFVTVDEFKAERKVKIHHSHIDADAYNKVITGILNSEVELAKISMPDDKEKITATNNISQCYKYFRIKLSQREEKEIQSVWLLLTGEKHNYLVNIDLDEKENEQAIFDTVNTAGVRLTCADTIKNAIFQRYIDILKTDDQYHYRVQEAIDLYKSNWEMVFNDNIESSTYWNTSRQSGRLYRDNIEILLHCIAVIEGFFNPTDDKMSDLIQKYKEKIHIFNKTELILFIVKIKKYAELYRKYLVDFANSTLYVFTDYFLRLFHICDVCEVSTFHPYLLKLLYLNEYNSNNFDFKAKCEELERYILLHAICRATTKNYNKECLQLINGDKSVNELLADCSDISSETYNSGLTHMYSNKLATVLLFWIELYNRNNLYADLKELKYTYTLEHIMPQKWQEHWSVTLLPVFRKDDSPVLSDDEANKIRDDVIYEIGNMTLLNSKLNTSLRNYVFDKKVKGEGLKRGMNDLAGLIITKDVIKSTSWDERNIYARSILLSGDIKKIWNIAL